MKTIIKPKKKLSNEARFNLKTGFGSLVSNKCAVDAGKIFPWWSALIIFLLAIFLPVIPIMTSVGNSNGRDYISTNPNYSVDRNLTIMTVGLKNSGDTLTVTGDNYMTYNKDSDSRNVYTPIFSYVNETNHQYEIMAYYLKDTDSKRIDEIYKEIYSTYYIIGTTTPKMGESSSTEIKYYLPTIFAFYENGLAMILPKANTTTVAKSFSGDWMNTAIGTDIIARASTVNGISTPLVINDISKEYTAGVYENWKVTFDEAYLAGKNRTFGLSTGIYLGVYAGLTLFLGLLIFLLTRGKTNVNRYLKINQCFQMSAWAALAPGILAMILGFIIPNYAVMFYIILFGVRIMWLTMKQLSPTYSGQNR